MTSLYLTDALLRYHPVVFATRWQVLLATAFGINRVAYDGDTMVVMRYWRGRYYVTKIVEG